MDNTPETEGLARSLLYERLASMDTCFHEMRTHARQLERSRDEQCRLLGISAERECGLRCELDRERDKLKHLDAAIMRVKDLVHENENLYRRLESVHEVYRLSSVCRELRAENDKLKAQQP